MKQVKMEGGLPRQMPVAPEAEPSRPPLAPAEPSDALDRAPVTDPRIRMQSGPSALRPADTAPQTPAEQAVRRITGRGVSELRDTDLDRLQSLVRAHGGSACAQVTLAGKGETAIRQILGRREVEAALRLAVRTAEADTHLQALGYSCGEAAGLPTTEGCAGLRQFKMDHLGLEDDRLDAATLVALRTAVAAEQLASTAMTQQSAPEAPAEPVQSARADDVQAGADVQSGAPAEQAEETEKAGFFEKLWGVLRAVLKFIPIIGQIVSALSLLFRAADLVMNWGSTDWRERGFKLAGMLTDVLGLFPGLGVVAGASDLMVSATEQQLGPRRAVRSAEDGEVRGNRDDLAQELEHEELRRGEEIQGKDGKGEDPYREPREPHEPREPREIPRREPRLPEPREPHQPEEPPHLFEPRQPSRPEPHEQPDPWLPPPYRTPERPTERPDRPTQPPRTPDSRPPRPGAERPGNLPRPPTERPPVSPPPVRLPSRPSQPSQPPRTSPPRASSPAPVRTPVSRPTSSVPRPSLPRPSRPRTR